MSAEPPSSDVWTRNVSSNPDYIVEKVKDTLGDALLKRRLGTKKQNLLEVVVNKTFLDGLQTGVADRSWLRR